MRLAAQAAACGIGRCLGSYPRDVQLDVPLETNSYGGTGMLFTGTVGVNAVVVTGWQDVVGEISGAISRAEHSPPLPAKITK